MGVWRVCAWAAAGVDDDLEVDVGVCGDGGGDVGPGGAGRAGVEVEGDQDEEGASWNG